jgi:hypothetical protein
MTDASTISENLSKSFSKLHIDSLRPSMTLAPSQGKNPCQKNINSPPMKYLSQNKTKTTLLKETKSTVGPDLPVTCRKYNLNNPIKVCISVAKHKIFQSKPQDSNFLSSNILITHWQIFLSSESLSKKKYKKQKSFLRRTKMSRHPSSETKSSKKKSLNNHCNGCCP